MRRNVLSSNINLDVTKIEAVNIERKVFMKNGNIFILNVPFQILTQHPWKYLHAIMRNWDKVYLTLDDNLIDPQNRNKKYSRFLPYFVSILLHTPKYSIFYPSVNNSQVQKSSYFIKKLLFLNTFLSWG